MYIHVTRVVRLILLWRHDLLVVPSSINALYPNLVFIGLRLWSGWRWVDDEVVWCNSVFAFVDGNSFGTPGPQYDLRGLTHTGTDHCISRTRGGVKIKSRGSPHVFQGMDSRGKPPTPFQFSPRRWHDNITLGWGKWRTSYIYILLADCDWCCYWYFYWSWNNIHHRLIVNENEKFADHMHAPNRVLQMGSWSTNSAQM